MTSAPRTDTHQRSQIVADGKGVGAPYFNFNKRIDWTTDLFFRGEKMVINNRADKFLTFTLILFPESYRMQESFLRASFILSWAGNSFDWGWYIQGHLVCPVAQSCSALCDPMGCSLLGSSVHGIFQARILEWVAISSSRGSLPNPGIQLISPAVAGGFSTTAPPRKPLLFCINTNKCHISLSLIHAAHVSTHVLALALAMEDTCMCRDQFWKPFPSVHLIDFFFLSA